MVPSVCSNITLFAVPVNTICSPALVVLKIIPPVVFKGTFMSKLTRCFICGCVPVIVSSPVSVLIVVFDSSVGTSTSSLLLLSVLFSIKKSPAETFTVTVRNNVGVTTSRPTPSALSYVVTNILPGPCTVMSPSVVSIVTMSSNVGTSISTGFNNACCTSGFPCMYNLPSSVLIVTRSSNVGTSTSSGFSSPGSLVSSLLSIKNLPSFVSTLTLSSLVSESTSRPPAFASSRSPGPSTRNAPSVVSTVT